MSLSTQYIPPSKLGSSSFDNELIIQAQGGNDLAFALLYERYYHQVYAYLTCMVGDSEVGKDLAQEAFFKAWKGLSGLRDTSKFVGWLYRITTNLANDHLRSAKRVRWLSWDRSDEREISKELEGVRLEVQIEEQELLIKALSRHTISPSNISHLVKLWTATIGDPIWSLAVAVNRVVYVSSHDSRLYALDARTGATLWTAVIGSREGTSASCWPVVVNGVVYVGSLDSRLYALDARTGITLWSSATGAAIWSPPVVVNGTVYVGSMDSRLYAFDARTGTTLWITDVGSAIPASPAVVNGIVYINSQDSMLHALNARTGATLWTTTIGNPNSSLDFTSYWPVVADGVVYVNSQDSKLYAFDARTGDTLWTVAIGIPDPNLSFTSSWPVVANGVVYVGSQDLELYAFDARTGTPLWSTPNAVFTSPVVANGVVYVGSQDSKLYAFGIK
jgi:RNA polymerase sigma factor (sigma-70 family)